jgi:hypothetical protein
MRMIFGLVSLLVVVGVLAYLAKTQLSTAADATGTATPAAPAQRSQQIQGQVKDDLSRALQQGADRAASAAP